MRFYVIPAYSEMFYMAETCEGIIVKHIIVHEEDSVFIQDEFIAYSKEYIIFQFDEKDCLPLYCETEGMKIVEIGDL